MILRSSLAALGMLAVAATLSQAIAQGTRDGDRRGDGRPGDNRRGDDRGGEYRRGDDGRNDDRRGEDRWVQLGCADVGRREEVVGLTVPRGQARYKAIRIEITDADIFVGDLRVIYGGGPPDTISIQDSIKQDTASAPIDLKGRDRNIDRVEFSARKRFAWQDRGRATACVSALEVDRRPPPDTWAQLGCVEVRRREPIQSITAGRGNRPSRAFRLEVANKDVDVETVRIVYDDGQYEDLSVRSRIKENTFTNAIELRGRGRAIQRVDIVTVRDFRDFGQRPGRDRATICVSALEDLPPPPPRGPPRGEWEELGCQKVGLFADRDTIKVGRREGRFKAIKLVVTGNSVYIGSLRVIYANGEPDDLQVRSEVREGGQTGPLALNGRQRAIDRVEMVYRAKPNFRGSAKVCIAGLQ